MKRFSVDCAIFLHRVLENKKKCSCTVHSLPPACARGGGAMTKILAAHGTDCKTPCSAEKATDHCMFVDVDVWRRNRLECKCRKTSLDFLRGARTAIADLECKLRVYPRRCRRLSLWSCLIVSFSFKNNASPRPSLSLNFTPL